MDQVDRLEMEHVTQALLAGHFELDFIEINLRQRGVDRAERVEFSGPGYARQQTDSSITLKCYNQRPSDGRIERFFEKQENGPSGRVIADDGYFDIEAIDLLGNRWSFAPEIIFADWHHPNQNGFVRADVRHLKVQTGEKGDDWRMRLTILKQEVRQWRALLEKPLSILVNSLNFEFKMTTDVRRETEIVVELHSTRSFPDEIPTRLLEALQFLLDQEIEPSVVDLVSPDGRVIELMAATKRPVEFNHPPLRTIRKSNAGSAGDLLQKYLNFIVRFETGAAPTPCAIYLSLSRQSETNSFDAQCLALCVAVEGFSKLIPVPVVATDDTGREEIKRIQSFITKSIEDKNYSQNLKDRINGFLDGLTNRQVKDVIKNMRDEGHISATDMQAYTKLRNTSVHTKGANIPKTTPLSRQKQLDSRMTVQKLLYSIIFHLIGYSGFYTNYAEIGYPEQSFPTLKD